MHFIQLSDTHITRAGQLAYGKVDTAGALRAAVVRILSLPQKPACVVITGDLVDHGDEGEYKHLRELISPLTTLSITVYLLPGNHDHRETMRRVFADHTYLLQGEFIQYVVKDAPSPLRLIALDTVKPGHAEGELCDARLDWLEAQLAAAPEAPTVVLMHHPPFETLIEFMDEMGLVKGADRLEKILRANPQVERVLCGHIHRSIEARFGGTIASVCSSPAHQIHLDMAPNATPGYTMEPPSIKLHAWSEKSGLITHSVAVTGWDEAQSFAG
jgi:3',5'-cyclic-AMP phosphodiesterase